MKIFVIGNIGSGKSTAAKMIADKLHAKLVDLDKLGHEALVEHKSEVEKVFGKFKDRSELSKLATGNISKLSEILNPYIYTKMLEVLDNENVVVEESVYDENFVKHADKIVCIKTDFSTRKLRATNKNFEKLNAAQEKNLEKYADYVIENNGSIADLERAVNELF